MIQYFRNVSGKPRNPGVRRPVKPGDDGIAYFLFLATFGFGSGVSACGSKPI